MYLDGELQAEDARPYLEHLEECADCRAFVEGEQRFRQTLRNKVIGKDRAPEHLRTRITEMSKPVAARVRYRLALATATMGLLVVVTFTTQSGFSPILQEVADKHRADLPMDIATQDPAEAQRFVERHVPRVHIPQLGGARFAGARVVDLPGQHKGVLATYIVDGQRVSVAVYPKNPAEEVAIPRQVAAGRHQVFLDRAGSLQAAMWNQEDLVYSMVGEVDANQLLHLVSAAQ